MPTYEYIHTKKKGKDCTDPMDIMQPMADDPLTKCPTCGNPVQKQVSAPNVGTNMLSSSNLAAKGFTKLVKRDKGVYEKE